MKVKKTNRPVKEARSILVSQSIPKFKSTL